ncbi:hypothetical protein [Helicobacter pylori]|nr:hypothetical protein [Helicobacter pylori]
MIGILQILISNASALFVRHVFKGVTSALDANAMLQISRIHQKRCLGFLFWFLKQSQIFEKF